MTSSPEVSVTIIFLDEERFLAEAVESVLAQSYTNWELLLVDDGSTDRSTEIARGYALANPDRIRYLEHPGHANRGMSASRNLGVRSARARTSLSSTPTTSGSPTSSKSRSRFSVGSPRPGWFTTRPGSGTPGMTTRPPAAGSASAARIPRACFDPTAGSHTAIPPR